MTNFEIQLFMQYPNLLKIWKADDGAYFVKFKDAQAYSSVFVEIARPANLPPLITDLLVPNVEWVKFPYLWQFRGDMQIGSSAFVLPTPSVENKMWVYRIVADIPSRSKSITQNGVAMTIEANDYIMSDGLVWSKIFDLNSVTNLLDSKVDKITGKGLSTNDFADTYKSLLDSLNSSLSSKQNNLTGTGFVKSIAGVISFDNNNYLTGITSSLVTTALGFTPYNATNPANYISSVPAQSFASLTGKPTTISGYGITDFNSLGDSRYSLLAHTHLFSAITSKPTTLSGYGITDAYPLTGNPSAFLTGITSSLVTTALGFTPYNATNPANYISSVPAQSFASLTGKPTTLAGYGITDAYPLTGNPSAFVVGTRTLTINGTTFDLSANRTWTISAGGSSAWADITGKPSSLSGYGITDPIVLSSGSYSDPAWLTLTKAKVGLGNVDNTSDANKPISTAEATALGLKANLASPNFTGNIMVGTTVSSGEMLQVNGSAKFGTTKVTGSLYSSTRIMTSTTNTVLSTDHVLLITSGGFTINWDIPTAALEGREIIIANLSYSDCNVSYNYYVGGASYSYSSNIGSNQTGKFRYINNIIYKMP